MKKTVVFLAMCLLSFSLMACGSTTPLPPDDPSPIGNTDPKGGNDNDLSPETPDPEPDALGPEALDPEATDPEPDKVEYVDPGEVIASYVPLDGFSAFGVNISEATLDSLQAASGADPYDEALFEGKFGFIGTEGYAITADGYSPDQYYLVKKSNPSYYVAMYAQGWLRYDGEMRPELGKFSEYSFALSAGEPYETVAALLELDDGEYMTPYGRVSFEGKADNQNAGSLSGYKLMRVRYPEASVYIEIFYDDAGVQCVIPVRFVN